MRNPDRWVVCIRTDAFRALNVREWDAKHFEKSPSGEAGGRYVNYLQGPMFGSSATFQTLSVSGAVHGPQSVDESRAPGGLRQNRRVELLEESVPSHAAFR